MTMKTVIAAAALVLATTTASLAQGYGYYAAPYGDGTYGYGSYGYDGYGFSYGSPDTGFGVYGYAPLDNPYRPRGGPGPRFGNGTGAGIGAER